MKEDPQSAAHVHSVAFRNRTKGPNDSKRYIRLVFEAVRFFHFLATPPPEYPVKRRGQYND
jgi:hypothetical protein